MQAAYEDVLGALRLTKATVGAWPLLSPAHHHGFSPSVGGLAWSVLGEGGAAFPCTVS